MVPFTCTEHNRIDYIICDTWVHLLLGVIYVHLVTLDLVRNYVLVVKRHNVIYVCIPLWIVVRKWTIITQLVDEWFMVVIGRTIQLMASSVDGSDGCGAFRNVLMTMFSDRNRNANKMDFNRGYLMVRIHGSFISDFALGTVQCASHNKWKYILNVRVSSVESYAPLFI